MGKPTGDINDVPFTERPWHIGDTRPTPMNPSGKWFVNVAVTHSSGSLTNDRLMRMTDDELRRLGENADGEPYSEKYRRPNDKGFAERQGGTPGQEYDGVHRAYILLRYREVFRT